MTMIGILGLQGGYAAHAKTLDKLEQPHRLVKKASDLGGLDALILPGGESTTMLKMMTAYALFEPLTAFANSGKPVLGTCAGAILMAESVNGRQQRSLGWLPVSIDRNYYGSQRDSFCDTQDVPDWDLAEVPVFFIRAPHFDRLGDGVRVLSHWQDHVTGVAYKNFTAVTYHPELADDTRFHAAWLAHNLPKKS